MKTLAIKLGPACKLYFCDDKAKVSVGEPDVYLSTGVRGNACLAPVNSTLGAADHDVSKKGSLTPSVVLQCYIPEITDKSFVRGQVSVFLNDSVFQASSPFRHAVQLIKSIREQVEVPAVLLKFSDGGSDYRNNLQSVQCSLICNFKELDLELLVAARRAPGQSWINPVERVMSVLNLGLQNFSLSRKACSDDMERLLHKYNGMDDLRNAGTVNPGLKTAWSESVEDVQQVIRSRFERLALKDKGILTRDPVSDIDVQSLKGHLEQLFLKLDLNKLHKAVVARNSDFPSWVERHCRQRVYSFQVCKCNDPSCCTSKTQQFQWLPDPVLDIDRMHYKCFDAVFGTDTTDCDRATAAKKPVKLVPKKPANNVACTSVATADQLSGEWTCSTSTGLAVAKAKSCSSGLKLLYEPCSLIQACIQHKMLAPLWNVWTARNLELCMPTAVHGLPSSSWS